jgi:hypothetical protein
MKKRVIDLDVTYGKTYLGIIKKLGSLDSF